MVRKNIISFLFSLLISGILLTIVFTSADTVSKYVYSITKSDSAEAAAFHIIYSAPLSLVLSTAESPLQHTFSEKDQILSFELSVINGREIPVRCTPYMRENVDYYVVVGEKILEDFVVDGGNTVDFTFVIRAEGLTSEMLATSLCVYVEQL